MSLTRSNSDAGATIQGEPANYIDPTTTTLYGFARWLSPDSPALIVLGALLTTVGFALIGVAWSEVAGTTNVGLQMPYLVSAGLTGLGLVMAGLLLINIATKRRDAAQRDRRLETLSDAVTQLRASLERIIQPDA